MLWTDPHRVETLDPELVSPLALREIGYRSSSVIPRPRTGTFMDSDEIPDIDDPTDAAWAAEQRERVVKYLATEKVKHQPRWH